MFPNDHILLNMPGLTALVLHLGEDGSITHDRCMARLNAMFATAGQAPGLPEDRIRLRLRGYIDDLEIAGLLTRNGEGWQLTEPGRKALKENPGGIDETDLMRFPAYATHLKNTAHHSSGSDPRLNSYDQGYVARQKGQPFTANPYSGNTVDHQSWENGWMQALDRES